MADSARRDEGKVTSARRDENTKTDRNAGLVSAFQNVTDGVLDLAKSHLELARVEVRHEVRDYAAQSARAAVGVGFALLGFGILNFAVVCVVGVFFGLPGMAVTATLLGATYVVGGLLAARAAITRMHHKDTLARTKDEFRRSTEWVKEIRDSS